MTAETASITVTLPPAHAPQAVVSRKSVACAFTFRPPGRDPAKGSCFPWHRRVTKKKLALTGLFWTPSLTARALAARGTLTT